MKFFGMWFLVVTSLLGFISSPSRSVDAAAINCGGIGSSSVGDDSAAAAITTQIITSDNASAKNLPNDETSTTSTTTTTTSAPAATETSDVKQFLNTVQCTLERAKPWVEQIEKEAKRLEQTAKRIGAGVISTFGDLMDKLMGSDGSGSILDSFIIGGGGGGGAVGGAATEAAAAADDSAAVDLNADKVASSTEGVDAVANEIDVENEIDGSNAAAEGRLQKPM